MALDVGSKTIGLALSDPLGVTVRPLATLRRRTLEADCEAVLELAGSHGVKRLVIGRPRHMDGREADIVKRIEPLAEELARRSGLPLQWYDERLSTREAEAVMGRLGLPISERRRRRNEFAAAVILEWCLREQDEPSDPPDSG